MKTLTALLRELDETLLPAGFQRRKHTWNRQARSLIDVVDVQLSKGLDGVWVNVGVFDPAVYARAWLREPPTFAQEPACTVRTRLGDLMVTHDGFWLLDDPAAGAAMATAVQAFALPYLERLHGPQALERTLESSPQATQSYPPPIIYLALLKQQRGEATEARRLLLDLRSRTNDSWSERVACVMQDAGMAT